MRSPAGRAVLSLLFVVHWGAVGTLIVLDTAAQRRLPSALRPGVDGALAPAARLGWPIARVWLDATASRQHWMLFAPAPSDWAVSTLAIVSYGGAVQDTLVVPGAAEDPLPHWNRPRTYDLAFNLAYEGTGTFYRTVEARRLCRGLRRDDAPAERLTLGIYWRPLDAPWADPPRAPFYQEVGRFDCGPLLAAPPPRGNP